MPTSEFQSTHPLRGATHVFYTYVKGFGISIHAPLAGCDLTDGADGDGTGEFQSTHPLRGATSEHYEQDILKLFQSTHPLRGATNKGRNHLSEHYISIHAPLAGCDDGAQQVFSARGDFNPRTPCGVRLILIVVQLNRRQISIHAPLAGCDDVSPHCTPAEQ